MIAFDNVGTIGNRKKYSTKQVQTVSLQPSYVSTPPGKTKKGQTFVQCLHFFPYLLENLFSSLLTKNLLPSHGF